MRVRFRFAAEGAVGCLLGLLFATLVAVPGATAQAPASTQSPPPSAARPKAYEGVITDTRCGAKHSAALAETAADCTRICVHSGEKFALVDGDKMYTLEGESESLKRAAGERVRIMGALSGKTISVVSVAPLR